MDALPEHEKDVLEVLMSYLELYVIQLELLFVDIREEAFIDNFKYLNYAYKTRICLIVINDCLILLLQGCSVLVICERLVDTAHLLIKFVEPSYSVEKAFFLWLVHVFIQVYQIGSLPLFQIDCLEAFVVSRVFDFVVKGSGLSFLGRDILLKLIVPITMQQL